MITGRIRGEVEVWKCGSVSFWSWLLAIFGPRQDMTGILWMSNVENQVGGPLWVTPVDHFTICSLKNGALRRYPWLTIRSFKNGRIIAWLCHVIAHNHLMWVKECHLHHPKRMSFAPFLHGDDLGPIFVGPSLVHGSKSAHRWISLSIISMIVTSPRLFIVDLYYK